MLREGNEVRYKLYFSLFMNFETNCLELMINIVSRYRLRAICGLDSCHPIKVSQAI